MTQIEKEGRGILLYMRQERRGIGQMEANSYDLFYLKTKQDRMGHILKYE